MPRLAQSSPLRRAIAALLLALNVGMAGAVDLGPWARHLRQHGAWTSLDFRHPVTGLFLAARAGIEDPRTAATLTLTAAPGQDCAAEAVIVHKISAPVGRGVDELRTVALQLDGSPPRQFQARLVQPRGDVFIFTQLPDELPLDELKNHSKLTVDVPGAGRTSFSLAGFASAWAAAQETCQAFLMP